MMLMLYHYIIGRCPFMHKIVMIVCFFTGRCYYTCKVISVEGKMNIQMREVCGKL